MTAYWFDLFNLSGRIDHTPRNAVGSPNQDDYALFLQTTNVFFVTDEGKRPKQVNSSKDEDDQYQSGSSGSRRDNHPYLVLEPDKLAPRMTTLMTLLILRMKYHRQ